jgi:hypothetical protein
LRICALIWFRQRAAFRTRTCLKTFGATKTVARRAFLCYKYSGTESGCGSMVECGLPKPEARVRFPSPAPSQGEPTKSIVRIIFNADAIPLSRAIPGCESRRSTPRSATGLRLEFDCISRFQRHVVAAQHVFGIYPNLFPLPAHDDFAWVARAGVIGGNDGLCQRQAVGPFN